MDLIKERVRESIETKEKIFNDEIFINKIYEVSKEISKTLKNGGKIIVCGNGGSASDSLHLAGEIVGRFQKERNPWPAIALPGDVATLTAVSNDYSYDEAFARATKAFAKESDFFIGISTSGNSENILRAMNVAAEAGCKTLALVGRDGGKMSQSSDFSLIVPSNVTARIQESHIMIIHILCELVEDFMTE